ncbi:uncharacterized protein LOC103145704 isoform X3 [Poecilia formosa]|uniref:uncharacterized protein LOC103145704 isoform X3 n=1 Tax=Poecilia formosa TaxID=48698 RepID=UPI0007B984FC|nr:PREDICTED: uncharacterized protein LOC103145704 isoform X3 [Poecilia formosa]
MKARCMAAGVFHLQRTNCAWRGSCAVCCSATRPHRRSPACIQAAGLWCEGLIGQKPVAMELHLLVTVCLLFGKIMTTHQTHMSSVYTYLFTPRGPQMFTCLTYLERNVRVDCEFLASDMVPGPYCEYRQDSRLVGSTYPNAVIYVSTEDRRRSNVSLVAPNLCRLTWAPLADEKPYTYTCRVYQGNGWKENSMAVHHRHLLICSAISVLFKSAPWVWSLVMSLPVAVGLLSP